MKWVVPGSACETLAFVASVSLGQRAKNEVFGVLPAQKMGREPKTRFFPLSPRKMFSTQVSEIQAYNKLRILHGAEKI